MMIKKILLLIVFVSFYIGTTTAFAETQEEVTARRKLRDELGASKSAYESAVSNRETAIEQQTSLCAGSNNTSQACQEAMAETKKYAAEARKLKGIFDSKNSAASSASTAAGDLKEDRAKDCEDHRKAMEKAKLEAAGEESNESGVPGSQLMRKCLQLTSNGMKNLYGSQRRNLDWKTLIAATPECIEASTQCGGDKDAGKVKKCKSISTLASKCDAAAYLINQFGRDWGTPEHVKSGEAKGGNPEIKCSSLGIETLDYDACVKFVQNGDIMDAAQAAIQTGQDLYYKDKAMTAQMEASSSADSATASLKALKTGVKGQEDIMVQRAAIDTGKFAALATYYSEIPGYDDLKEKCNGYRPIEGLDKKGCESAVQEQPGFGFLQNQTAKEKMKAKLAKVGIDVASNVVMANLLSKRANDIDNAIAKVDAFKPIDPLAPATDNLQSTYCQQNPGDAKCLTGGLERTFDAMGDNVITFGDGATGTSYNNPNPYVDPTAGTTGSNSPGSKNAIPGVGSVIAANHQDGGLESRAAAATISKGTAPAAGGGGGASGGGAGGGGGATPGAQPQGGTSAAIQGKTPGYNGGGGTLSMMGGYGINKNKGAAKEDGNPFGKLFNKDGNKSAVLNFGRGPASVGNKGDNLFEMISKRYTTVSSDKRLIEYEMTK